MAQNQKKKKRSRSHLKFNFTYSEGFSGQFVDCRNGLWTFLIFDSMQLWSKHLYLYSFFFDFRPFKGLKWPLNTNPIFLDTLTSLLYCTVFIPIIVSIQLRQRYNIVFSPLVFVVENIIFSCSNEISNNEDEPCNSWLTNKHTATDWHPVKTREKHHWYIVAQEEWMRPQCRPHTTHHTPDPTL